jgi:hypothetical protein
MFPWKAVGSASSRNDPVTPERQSFHNPRPNKGMPEGLRCIAGGYRVRVV